MPKKRGGWLFFFIFTLLVLSPLYNLALIIRNRYAPLEMVEALGGISLLLLAGVFLLQRRPYALTFTKAVLATNLILALAGLMMRKDLLQGLSAIGYPLIWLWYLDASHVVDSIYGKLKEKKEGLQAWPVLAAFYGFLAPVTGFVFGVIGLRKIIRNNRLRGMELCLIGIIVPVIILTAAVMRGVS